MEFAGTIKLQADLIDGTIEGCLGCEGDIQVLSLHLANAFERFEMEPVELLAHPKDYEVHFAPTRFNPESTFETNEGVTVMHPERSVEQVPYGFWGGSFSNRRDGEGNPRLVAGFNQVLFYEKDGSASFIVGIFDALSESFRTSGKTPGP